MSSQVTALSAVFALLALVIPNPAASECPASTVSVTGRSASGDVVYSQSITSQVPENIVTFNSSSAAYDLAEGRLRAVVNVDSVHKHTSEVVAIDRFELHNVPAAIITVRLNLSLLWMADPSARMAWAGASARLTAGVQSVHAETMTPNLVPYIELQIAAVEGVPFEVVYETSAEAWGYYPSATMTCHLEFAGVPGGAEITSCNGYGLSKVPVKETTWGGIKALYR